MKGLILEKEPKSPVSESYRTLRTNIDFSSIDSETKKILVTSSGPQEGKSTVSSNLALAMAASGKKTIFIDCDLRKPTVHKKFKLSNLNGLSNLLVEGLKIEDIAICYAPNLDVLTSGTIPANPSEIITSNKMKLFLEEVQTKYERIIIDSPPLNAVTDGQILATLVDGVVLVVASGSTEVEGAKKAKELLDNVQANITGVVLNKAERIHSKKYSYNSYYYYYGENGHKKSRRKKEKKKNKKINTVVTE
ncbi:MAG: CpsD/CapB family tyrosine-protein kinase [Clostridiaceae bacterium]